MDKSKCIVCGKEFTFKPQNENIFGIDISSLKPTICSNECEYAYQQEKQREVNENTFWSILKNMPDAYMGVKMEDFQKMDIIHAKSGKSISAKEIIKRFTESEYWNLTLQSEQYGNGKTRLGLYTLACAALKGIYRTTDMQNIHDCGYFSAIEITDILRQGSYESRDYHKRLFSRARILMIDDLGQEEKKYKQDLEGIIKNREENNRKTIITTNKSQSALKELYSERVVSRIMKGVFVVNGEDLRL